MGGRGSGRAKAASAAIRSLLITAAHAALPRPEPLPPVTRVALVSPRRRTLVPFQPSVSTGGALPGPRRKEPASRGRERDGGFLLCFVRPAPCRASHDHHARSMRE